MLRALEMTPTLAVGLSVQIIQFLIKIFSCSLDAITDTGVTYFLCRKMIAALIKGMKR